MRVNNTAAHAQACRIVIETAPVLHPVEYRYMLERNKF